MVEESDEKSKDALAKVMGAILDKYKSVKSPRFEFVMEVFRQRPYRDLESKLAQFGSIEDLTDINYDRAFSFVINDGEEEAYVELSMVGPFAEVRRKYGSGIQLIEGKNRPYTALIESILDLLLEFRMTVLDEAILKRKMNMPFFDAEPGDTRLYQVLFLDNPNLPWDAVG